MLFAMTLGRELEKALDAAGMKPAQFARAIGYKNSGGVTAMLKDRRPLPEERLPIALEVLGLNKKGHEHARDQFLRELLLSYLPEDVRPILRSFYHSRDTLEARYQRLLAEVRER